MSQLKKIDLNAKSFIANEVEYFIEESMSFKRYKMYQKLQIQMGFGTGFYDEYNDWKKVWDHANKSEFGNIAVVAHNKLYALKNIDERPTDILTMCALFINTKDEDRRIITDDMVDRKIADWEAEGLDIIPFFQLAANSIQGFTKVWKSITEDISPKEEEKKK